MDEVPRSQAARQAAETALVRIAHHYGEEPEFVVLGGLVPGVLCNEGHFQHAGTTDIDVQVNLEIAKGSANAAKLENALRNAEFKPDDEHMWRWGAEGTGPQTIVKFELLADLDDQPANATIVFDGCDQLGAANLRGTGFAVKDWQSRELRGRVGDDHRVVAVRFAGLAGFLLAKIAAAHSRGLPKDWYDCAFVLQHNNAGGPAAAARAVNVRFASELKGGIRTALKELRAAFQSTADTGSKAYTKQFALDHPDQDKATVAADAVLVVGEFCKLVLE